MSPNGEVPAQEGARRERRLDFRDTKKHFVRKNGWLPVVQAYSEARDRRVRYLTLCSKEAIDVRYFAQQGCLYRNRDRNQYPSLSFIESDPQDYATIAETLGKPRFSALGRLEDIVLDAGHESHAEFIETFPYDVVNLDFCGDILPHGDHPYNRTLQCISRIIELQSANADEWHLFLTFRAQPAGGSPEANQQLVDRLQGNINAPGVLQEAYGARQLPGDLVTANYAEFLRIGIPKLLAYVATQNSFSFDSESSFVYGRHQNQYKMVKIIAKLSRLGDGNAMPDPAADQAAYAEAVKGIFESEPVDVDTALPASQTETEEDLQPVIEELTALGIVVT